MARTKRIDVDLIAGRTSINERIETLFMRSVVSPIDAAANLFLRARPVESNSTPDASRPLNSGTCCSILNATSRLVGLNRIDGMIQMKTSSVVDAIRTMRFARRHPDWNLTDQSVITRTSVATIRNERVVDTRRTTSSLLACLVMLSSCLMTCFIYLYSHCHWTGNPIRKRLKTN